MNQQKQNTASPPKSPYQLFIEENDQLLNSISQNDIQFQSNIADSADLNLQEEENSESEYYESLKESLDSINAKLGISSKKKEGRKINSNTSNIEKSRDDSIAKIDSQSEILPSKKEYWPSPLNKNNKREETYSISSEKGQNLINSENENSIVHNSNVNEISEDKNSQYSMNSNAKTKSRVSGLITKSPSNSSNNLKNTPTKEQTQKESKQITTPQNKSASSALHQPYDDNSIKSTRSISSSKKNNSSSKHSQTPNIKKESSVVSNHSQTPNIKKESSFVSNHSQASNIKKENSFVSNHSQTSNIKKENSFVSNHSQTPTIKKQSSIVSNHSQASSIKKENSTFISGNQSPSIKKENSIISNHNQNTIDKKDNSTANNSQTPNSKKGSSSSLGKSMITTSYIDYIDNKQKKILEKWKKEDLEEQRNLEEEMIDRLLTPKHTWKTFKFTSPRGSISSRSSVSNDTKTEISSNLNDDDDDFDNSIDDPNQNPTQVFKMPPNPSSNLKQMLEIPAIERLITPKKNLTMQQQQQQNKKKQNSSRPKKIKPMNEENFVSRQAHYENEKRLKKTMENSNNQPQKTKRKNNDDVFNKLFENSIVDDFNSSDDENNDLVSSNETEKRSKIKWSNKSHLVESKKNINSEPPINTSNYRDDRFSPMSQKFAQNESRSFQERTSIDFDDILRQNREEHEQKKKRDLYNEHIESLD